MTELNLYLTLSIAALAGLAMMTSAALSGWRVWLALKRSELEGSHAHDLPTPTAGARIEIADLKERIRKLEAIAAGVDL